MVAHFSGPRVAQIIFALRLERRGPASPLWMSLNKGVYPVSRRALGPAPNFNAVGGCSRRQRIERRSGSGFFTVVGMTDRMPEPAVEFGAIQDDLFRMHRIHSA
jgi:hypothetical protein